MCLENPSPSHTPVANDPLANYINFILIIACWASDSHCRPGFAEILVALDEVRIAFAATPHESFHTMQEDWRLEIEQVLHGLRMKEKVNFAKYYHLLKFVIQVAK